MDLHLHSEASSPSSKRLLVSRDRLLGYAAALCVMLIWAGFALVSRYGARGGSGGGLTPWDIGALRFAVSGAVAAGLWLAGIGRGVPIGRALTLALFAGLGFALPAYVGFSLAPAAHGAVLLSGTLPFLVAVGAWLAFNERWGRARVISLALALAGLVLLGIEAYARQSAPPGAWRGDLLFLLASCSWATFTVLARRWSIDPLQSVVAIGIAGAALFLPVWWLALPSRIAETPVRELLFQGVYQGLLAMVVSLFLYTRALASIGIARLTTITALSPGLASVLAVPLLHEPIGALSLAGLALVCGAVAVGVRTRAAA